MQCNFVANGTTRHLSLSQPAGWIERQQNPSYFAATRAIVGRIARPIAWVGIIAQAGKMIRFGGRKHGK
jgi:hypothetical protein